MKLTGYPALYILLTFTGLTFNLNIHAQNITSTAETIVRSAKSEVKRNQERIRQYQMTIRTKTFFETMNKKNQSFEMRGALLSETEHYRNRAGKIKIIETANRNLNNLLIDEYIPYKFDIIENLSSGHITLVNASAVGPLAENAGEYYEYRLDGKKDFNGIPSFEIILVPKSENVPLLKGRLYIQDSTFRITGAVLSVNDAVKIWPKPRHFSLSQSYAVYQDSILLPNRFEYQYELEINYMGIEETGLWRSASQVINTKINTDLSDGVFSGPPVEKPRSAFYRDSSFWNPVSFLKLSEREAAGLFYLSNLKKNKAIVYPDQNDFDNERLERDYRLGFSPMPDPRFNRVEGPFLGGILGINDLAAGPYFRAITLRGEYGYGFRDKRHKWLGEISKTFFEKRFGFGGRVYDHIQQKESLYAGSMLMNSLTALGYRYDNFNYFYTRGYELFMNVKPFYPLELQFIYTDRDDRSARQNSKFGIVHFLYAYKPVYPINEGRLKQFTVKGQYQFGNGKGIAPRNAYLRLNGSVDYSSPKHLNSDFRFTKYFGSMRYHIPTTRRGSLDGRISLGYATEAVPRQYVFDLYGGSLPYMLKTIALGDIEGNYMAAMTIEHNFGGAWLERTGLPLLKDGYIDMIPNLSIGYAKTSGKTNQFVSSPVRDTKKPLLEIGLAFGDIYRIARVDFAYRINQHKATESFWILTASAFIFNE